jgi:hypothetical protein
LRPHYYTGNLHYPCGCYSEGPSLPPLIVTLAQHPRHDQQRIITLHVNIDSRIYIRYQWILLTRPIARHLIRRPVKDILQSTLSHRKPSSPSPGDPLQKIFRIVIFRLQEESVVVDDGREIVGQFKIIVCFGLKPISRLIVSFLARRALAPAGTRDLYFIMSVIFVEMYVCIPLYMLYKSKTIIEWSGGPRALVQAQLGVEGKN